MRLSICERNYASPAFMFLCGLSLTTGFILDSVAKVDSKQWELRVNAESTD